MLGSITAKKVVEEELVRKFAEAGLAIAPDALEFIKGSDSPAELADRLLKVGAERNLFVIEKTLVQELLETKETAKIPMPVEVVRAPDFKPLAKEYEPKLRFFDKSDVTGKSKCAGRVEDFVTFFRDRLHRTKKMLEARGNGSGVMSTKVLANLPAGREVQLVGLVSSKRTTRKEDLLIELEDEEGIAKVWVGKGRNEQERRCFEAAKNLLLDEAVAISGKISGPFVIASEVFWLDIPVKAATTIEEELGVAFLSDLHVGSKLFLEERFSAFIGWLNGAGGEKERELAGKVKYIVVGGDVVDGIGIYPRQERELVVRDIFEQYRMFAKLMQSVPDYIEVIIAPGNHDAVRRADPQPALSDEIAEAVMFGRDFHLVGSPSMVEMEGLKALIYHGTSLDSIIAGLPGMSYTYPEKPMVELLRRRNLSPLFGDNPIVPESKDYMVIEDVPDILHMGHVHKNGYEKYKGTIVVNSGTWQARTDFQVKQGHVPSPCLLPVYDMKRGQISVVDFNEPAAQAAPVM